jgi:hypothetical protein
MSTRVETSKKQQRRIKPITLVLVHDVSLPRKYQIIFNGLRIGHILYTNEYLMIKIKKK